MKKLDYKDELTEDHFKEMEKWKTFNKDKIAD